MSMFDPLGWTLHTQTLYQTLYRDKKTKEWKVKNK